LLEGDTALAKKLVGYANRKTRDMTRATDAAQEAVARMLEGRGSYRWDPTRKSLLNHLADVVDTVVANERRRAATRREKPIDRASDDDGKPHSDRHPDSRPNAEQQAASIEERQTELRLAAEVMTRVEKDPVIPGMLALEEEGIHDAAEQARRLGCTVKDIYRARERLAYHRDAVLAQRKKTGGAP
jgi:DNA-directed RNA polymerase specialized sigma24 family protein